ncbi:nonselective cation channel [Diaporthe helianthi]|uniref:Nonselective cation channel n=1 Tax=Diaporthe helianthi TaxID=158607 RepID=A0A2P5HFK5_DIAHE|nr:nonselective cation channel [Diaporthe helianthi]
MSSAQDHNAHSHNHSHNHSHSQNQDQEQHQDRDRPSKSRSNRHLQIEEPERRPLLRRQTSHEPDTEPVSSCVPNPHSHLPVYTNIHRIRRDVVSIVEDYMSLEQLRDVRINISVIRPLVDKLYDLDDISIVYCLLVNRTQFLHEQSHLHNRQNVNFTRATLCELVATRILRRFNEDNEGTEGLLILAHILVAGFSPFLNAPGGIRRVAATSATSSYHTTLPALEVAILSESKLFLSSTSCQKVIDAIYEGRVIYTPSSFINIIPDRYKQKPISLYDPRASSLLDQYRLIVPRTRNILEIMQFVILLLLYVLFMAERDSSTFSIFEVMFSVYSFGWVLDNFATILEHGWQVYTQNLWSFLDVTFAVIFWIYLVLRIQGWRTNSRYTDQQALDVLAMGAPVLIPRLAFNLLSNNLLFVSLRAMMADFTTLTALAAWCFAGFLLSLIWLSEGHHSTITVSKWLLWIWFGLDGTGIQRAPEFHQILGPCLMVTFAFLGNTLFLTILVSMLSNTFSTIVSNATAEVQYRHAVQTLEGVKSDAIFAYQPPFNILALFILVPLKFVVSPRWFHKIHVAAVRLLNLPLLLIIAAVERRVLWPVSASTKRPGADTEGDKRYHWFWEKWRITTHGDIHAVFGLSPPDEVEEAISVDDDLTRHMIRRQFQRNSTADSTNLQNMIKQFRTKQSHERDGNTGTKDAGDQLGATPTASDGRQTPKSPAPGKVLGRRDSMAPFPGLRQELQGIFNDSEEISDLTTRLEALEDSNARIEAMLARLVEDVGDSVNIVEASQAGKLGTLDDLDRTADEQ